MKKNGYNMDTAKVLCGASPDDFLGNLLAQELWASGFRVSSNRTQARPTAPIVRGVLDQFFVEPKSNFFGGALEGDIGLTLFVEMPNGVVARRRFYVKGEEASLFWSAQDIQAAIDRATRELMLDAVGAIANLLDRVPSGVGDAPAPPGAARQGGGP